MPNLSHSLLAGAAVALLMAGCQKNELPAVTSAYKPSSTLGSAASIPPVSTRDPSVPDASKVFAAQDAADRAKAMQDAAAVPGQSAPQKAMTQAEESKAMPLPGPASDHSTTALDKKKGG
ncbi:MAG: hypothetical protein ABI724_01075 [Betaproteobacteria bacterium]